MKGNNYMTLCEAQMQVIVQEWVDRNIKDKPLVTSVNYGGNSEHSFRVIFSDAPRDDVPTGSRADLHDGVKDGNG